VIVAVWIGVAVLGGFGAIARFLVDGRVSSSTGRTFPFGTLAVNLTGAFALGVVFGASIQGDAYVLAGTATVGSYSTFSTWMYETQRMAEDGQVRGATLNVVVSLALGLAVAAIGRWIGGSL
jgi:CrcB protein